MYEVFGKDLDLSSFKTRGRAQLLQHIQRIVSMTAAVKSTVVHIDQKSCYICDSLSSTNVFRVHEYQYVKCNDCGHVYTSSRPSSSNLEEFYRTNEYWSEVTYANSETYLYRKAHVASPKYQFLRSFLKGNVRGMKWIDIGCGIGDVISVAKDDGFIVEGLELSDTSREFARQNFGIELKGMSIHDFINYPNAAPYDVISLIGLLEHVADPLSTLSKSVSLAHPNSLFLIQVPNADSLTTKLQQVFSANVYRHASPIEHIQLFTIESLSRLLSNFNLNVYGVWWHGLDIHQLFNELLIATPQYEHSEAQSLLTSIYNQLQREVDKTRQSDRILVVAGFSKPD